MLVEELGVHEVFEAVRGRPGAHVSVGHAAVPARPDLRARPRDPRRARSLHVRERPADVRSRGAGGEVRHVPPPAMNRFLAGNRVVLLRSGGEFFPALVGAIDRAQHEVWLETYIFADDDAGRIVAAALCRAARRGVKVRVLVDGWGARHYLTRSLETIAGRGRRRVAQIPARGRAVAVSLASAAAAASQARARGRADRVRRRHQRHRRREHAGSAAAARGFRRQRRGPAAAARSCGTMQRVWAINELVQFQASDVPLFPRRRRAAATPAAQTAKFVIRDNLRHRRDIESAYLAAIRRREDRRS